MRRILKFAPRGKMIYLLIALIIVAVYLSSIIFINYFEAYSQSELDKAVNFQMTNTGKSIELMVKKRIVLFDALESFVRVNSDVHDLDKRFYAFSKNMIKNDPYIKNVSIAPNGIQSSVYPLKGNEMVLGHNILADKRNIVKNAVDYTIKTGKVAISSPYELRQGGMGVPMRKAIFIDNKLWGLITMMYDVSEVKDYLDKRHKGGTIDYSMFASPNSFFYGDKFDLNNKKYTYTITLPDGEWVIHGEPSQSLYLSGVSNLNAVKMVIMFSDLIIVIILIGIGIYNYKLQKTLKDLGIAQEKLVDYDRKIVLNNMIINISHKMNTPLGIIITAGSYLSQNIKNLEHQIAHKRVSMADLIDICSNISSSINMIEANASNATDIIKSLKRITNEDLQDSYQVVDLKPEINRIVAAIKIENENSYIEVQCKDNFMVNTKVRFLDTILVNLIENAIVHGYGKKESAQAEVTVLAEDYQGRLRLTVTDYGIGICQEILSKIFDPFFTSNMNISGGGLGLYIVKNLVVSELKGTISCHNIESGGTIFAIEIPCP